MLRVLRLSRRAHGRGYRSWMWLVTVLGDRSSLRLAAAKPPASTASTKVAMLMMLSICFLRPGGSRNLPCRIYDLARHGPRYHVGLATLTNQICGESPAGEPSIVRVVQMVLSDVRVLRTLFLEVPLLKKACAIPILFRTATRHQARIAASHEDQRHDQQDHIRRRRRRLRRAFRFRFRGSRRADHATVVQHLQRLQQWGTGVHVQDLPAMLP